jgi:acetyl-CoA carboxylase biotin carboxyl carrier protein
VIKHTAVEVVVDAGQGSDGELLLCSPAVGRYGFAPRVGEVVVGGSRVGRLNSLGRTVELVVPHGVTGRVAERQLATRSDPVEYGQVLLRLVPVEASEVGEGIVTRAQAASRDLPEGTFAVTSPTHGMFYRRPRPDAPAYVDVGHVVEEGATLALVEVMKCFSAITYGGDELPPRAEIVEVRADDGSEIEADQILFVVRPA